MYQVKQYALAAQALLVALSLPQTTYQRAYTHGWLAQVYGDTQQAQRAQYHAEQSFALRNHVHGFQAACRKAIAYSLYGDKPIYCESMVLNAQFRQHIYPDWEMLVYHDDSVPAHVLHRLEKLNVILLHVVAENISHWRGTFWRFLALERLEYDVVIMRDADSLLSEREKMLVNDWLATGKPFHVIRDWYSHTNLILAGLWGARNGLLSAIRTWVNQYHADNTPLHPTHADQLFLEQYIWYRIQSACTHHSSAFQAASSTWLPELPQPETGTQALGSWLSKSAHFQLPANKHFCIQIVDKENQQIICEYVIRGDEPFDIPQVYYEQMQKQKWALNGYEVMP